MLGLLKKGLVVVALLVGGVVAVFLWSFWRDQRNFAAAANPCERACIQDSGGLDDCRAECASPPLPTGPIATSTDLHALFAGYSFDLSGSVADWTPRSSDPA